MHGLNAYKPSPTVPMDLDPPFDPTGLKEIGNLASWTVSTYKPGCGVEALRDDDTNMFWQYVTYIRRAGQQISSVEVVSRIFEC